MGQTPTHRRTKMPHIASFVGEYYKNAQSQDKFVKPKCMIKKKKVVHQSGKTDLLIGLLFIEKHS